LTDEGSAAEHVLEFRLARGELRVAREADLSLELPPGIELPDPAAAKGEELDRTDLLVPP
jgi:hypothetical protein